MYHISDCKKFNRCPILFWNDQNAENIKSDFQQFVRLDEKITSLAIEKLKLKHYFLGERNDPKERVLNALNDYEWFVKARFEYDSLRIKVPFLHRTSQGYDVYFLFVGLYPQATDMQFYADTVWVLLKNHIEINQMYIIHLNANYVREEELDVDALFTISSTFYTEKKNPSFGIKEAVMNHLIDLSPQLRDMESCTKENLPQPKRTSKCAGRQKCRYYNDCFEEEHIENNSILTLSGARYRYDMQKEGRLYLKDADISRIEGTRLQYAQIQADYNGGLFVDGLALQSWFEKIVYPISFLDFEWERFAVPPYVGMRPYDVLPFEYSLHVLYEDGHIEHKVFLSIHDDRRELAESLIRDIPSTGSVIAYNAFGAEAIRIEEMMHLFHDLAKPLENINARMEDLQLPFESGVVYDTRMKGLWSLKVIMSMMDDPGYKALEIHQGMDAVYEWRRLDREEDGVNRDQIIENLKAYCGMDSYAMTVIFKWLKQLTKQ